MFLFIVRLALGISKNVTKEIEFNKEEQKPTLDKKKKKYVK